MLTMTIEEKEKFAKMEQGVEDIRSDVGEIKHALIGNQLSGDKGLIGQVTTLKEEVTILKESLKVVQNDAIENRVIIRQLKFVTGAAVTSLLILLIKIIFN